MRVSRNIVMHATVVALAVFLSGCGGGSGPRLYRVSGVLTVQGNPLKGVRVQLFPVEGKNKNGIIASGVTDSSGRYVVSSPGGSGAAAGTYKVVLTSEDASTRPQTQEEAQAKAAERAEMMKGIQEASKKVASNKGAASGPSPAAMKEAMSKPGGMEKFKADMEQRAKGRVTEMDNAFATTNKGSGSFPPEFTSAVTSPQEVEVKDQAVVLDLKL